MTHYSDNAVKEFLLAGTCFQMTRMPSEVGMDSDAAAVTVGQLS